jgi:hypothetical protein
MQAKWFDGPALAGFGLSENEEGLPQGHGLPRTLNVEAILSESQAAAPQAVIQ